MIYLPLEGCTAKQHDTFRPSSGLLESIGRCSAYCLQHFLAFKLSMFTQQPILNWSRHLARLEDTISLNMPMGPSSGIAPEFLGSQPSVLAIGRQRTNKKVGLVYIAKPTKNWFTWDLGLDLWEIKLGMTALQILPI
jgi:hypothetical protein